jgi:hypothetical protein
MAALVGSLLNFSTTTKQGDDMRTEEEKLEWELQAYGCPQKAIDEQLKEFRQPLSFAVSILSDAQELISPEFCPDGVSAARANSVRLLINRAKYVVFKTTRDQMESEAVA